MNLFLDKIQQAHRELVNEKGQFLLFAGVELTVNQNEWDIVVCADWLPKRKRAAIDIIFDKLEQILVEDDFLTLSRVIILNKEDSFYCELKRLVKENTHFMSNVIIDGLDVKQIHILQFAPLNTINQANRIPMLQNVSSTLEMKHYA